MNKKLCLPCYIAWSTDVCLGWSFFALLKDQLGRQQLTTPSSKVNRISCLYSAIHYNHLVINITNF